MSAANDVTYNQWEIEFRYWGCGISFPLVIYDRICRHRRSEYVMQASNSLIYQTITRKEMLSNFIDWPLLS